MTRKRQGIYPIFGLLVVMSIIGAGCLSVSGEDGTEDSNLGALNFTNYVGVTDVRDTFLVFGTAQNTADLPIQRVRLRIDYLDANRSLVATRVFDESPLILPGQSWEFEFPFTDPVVPMVRFYTITPLRIELVR